MRTSARGLALIKHFEGFPNNGCPYRDPIGIPTRGYGRIEGITMGSPCISEAEASRELVQLLASSYEPHVRTLGLPLNQNQFDTITSAVYNLGPGVLARGRSLGDALRSGNRFRVGAALLLYVNAGGRPFLGLIRRRNAERKLYLSPAYGVRFSDLERVLMRRKLTPATRRALRAQARKVQLAARATPGGWKKHDREDRFQALRRRALTKR